MSARAPWHAHYDPGVPATLAPYPEATLLDFVAATAARTPDEPALVFKGSRTSWAQLGRMSDGFAGSLCRLGVGRGDRVALLMPNCPQFVIAELGAWKAGATVVPLNPLYTEPELERALVRTGCTAIVTLTTFYARVKAVQPRTPLRHVIATSIKEHLPPMLRVLFTLFLEKKGGHRAALASGDHRFRPMLRAAPPPAASAARPEDVAFILMSGGTTGTPKGVVCPHRSIVISGLQSGAWLAPVIRGRRVVMMVPLPLFHAAGGIGGQATCLVGGHTLLLVANPRDLDDLVRTIRKERPAIFGGVPALYNALVNHPEVTTGRADLSSVELCLSGAAPLMAETKRRFEAVTGGRLIEAYSLTEALIAAIAHPAVGAARPGCAGLPGPDVEACIRDVEAPERVLRAGEVGEITLRAPQVMPGYWNDPAETAIALRDHGDGAPWLHTGDLGYLDEDGYLFIVDRLKDLIKPSGFQVWPREVEEVIATHPAVAEVGVAGVPDPARGEVAKAWVVLRPGATASADEIRGHCKARLAPYKVPAQVEFRTELPKSMVGKVLRRALVQQHRAAQG